jgi:hypothetical protein
MRNYELDEDIKLIIHPNTLGFQSLIEVYLVYPETSSVIALCGLAGQVSSFLVRLGCLTHNAC